MQHEEGRGFSYRMGPPSNLHPHPMMPASKVTLGRGRRAGCQASVVRTTSHSSQHDCRMKPALGMKKGPPGCFLIHSGGRVRAAQSLIHRMPISLSTEIGLFYPQEKSTVLYVTSLNTSSDPRVPGFQCCTDFSSSPPSFIAASPSPLFT